MMLVVRLSYWVLLSGLVCFALLFGTPFLSKWASGHVLSSSGCQEASFDSGASCPEPKKHIEDHFAPLNNWMLTFIAPVLLVVLFWDVLLVWVGVVLVLAWLDSFLHRTEG
jgi:hypothetical protein